VIAVLLMFSGSAIAANPCASVSTTLSAAEKKMYAQSISSNLTKWEPPAQIKIEKAISLKNWTAVWATPKNTEQGIFFYSQEKSGLKFHDVRGGFALPSDKPNIVRWIKKLSSSVPDDFAECAAETITGGTLNHEEH
jgi:hypothetical protein